MSPTPARETFHIWPLLATYLLLLIYGTLFPLSNWQTPQISPFALMLQHGLYNASRADMLTNILVYMPLGVLLMRAMAGVRCILCRLVIATLLCAGLSLTLEYGQAHLPGRVPSVVDLILNSFGGFFGGLFTLFIRTDSFIGKRLIRIRLTYFHPGPVTNLGLAVAGFWALSQLSPLVPSIDLGNLRHGLKPLIHTLQSPSTLEWLRVYEYGFGIAALGILSSCVQRIRYNSQLRFALFVLVVLFLKIPVVGRQFSLEACLGMGIGLVLTLLLSPRSLRIRLGAASILLLLVIVSTAQYAPPQISNIAAPPQLDMNWIPFRAHLTNNITGIISILGSIWPFIFLGYIALVLGCKRHLWIAVTGAILIFCLMFTLEWMQQYIPGRTPDITDAIIPTAAWLFPWLYPAFWRSGESTTYQSTTNSTRRKTA